MIHLLFLLFNIYFDRSIAKKLDRPIARSTDHSIARSLDRSIARSLDRSMVPSLDRMDGVSPQKFHPRFLKTLRPAFDYMCIQALLDGMRRTL